MGRWEGDKGWLDTGPGPLANCKMISKGSGNIVTRGRMREREREMRERQTIRYLHLSAKIVPLYSWTLA